MATKSTNLSLILGTHEVDGKNPFSELVLEPPRLRAYACLHTHTHTLTQSNCGGGGMHWTSCLIIEMVASETTESQCYLSTIVRQPHHLSTSSSFLLFILYTALGQLLKQIVSYTPCLKFSEFLMVLSKLLSWYLGISYTFCLGRGTPGLPRSGFSYLGFVSCDSSQEALRFHMLPLQMFKPTTWF